MTEIIQNNFECLSPIHTNQNIQLTLFNESSFMVIYLIYLLIWKEQRISNKLGKFIWITIMFACVRTKGL